jgi:hypothetical protein
VRVRAAALLLVLLSVLAAGCGPLDAVQSGGVQAEPVEVLDVLPSPDALRGEPARAADAAALQLAFTGTPDRELTEIIDSRDPLAAGVRDWSDPSGGTLTAAASVWGSHLTATGVGSDLATRLVGEGAEAWTPSSIPGSRGARLDQEGRRELRLAYSVGPNSFYVRATGDVPEEILTRTLDRMITIQRGAAG